MAVSKRLRYEILRRDSHTCRYCGAKAPDVPLRVDHVTPVALGGGDEPANLATSCEDCNNGKSSMPADAATVADVADDALRWAAAMEQAADVLLRQDKPKLAYRETFVREWNRWGYGEGDSRKKIELPGDWKASLERFRVAGLPDWAWAEIVDASMGNKKVKNEGKFKYCCGIAWNQVTVIQQEARRILRETAPEGAELDIDDIDALAVGAAHLVWGQEWAYTFKSGPTPEQVEQFKTSAREALIAGRKPHEVLEAAEYAVWFGEVSAKEGLAHLDRSNEFNRQYIAHEVFTHAWYHAAREMPSDEVTKKFWDDCVALYEAGAHPVQVSVAAAIAGSRMTTHMHYGLMDCDMLNAIQVIPAWQRAEDLWALAWRHGTSGGSWPTEDEREAFRSCLGRIRDTHRHWYLDVDSAAITAGSYGDCDLGPHLLCKQSVLEVAGFPLPGGEV
jgi:hypothetical protein